MRKSGFGEQSFIAEMRQKVRRTREMAILPMGADGGITADTLRLMIQVEAQVLMVRPSTKVIQRVRCVRLSRPEVAPLVSSRPLTSVKCILSRRKIQCRK